MDFGRLIVAMATPFDRELGLDEARVGELARLLEREGVSALVVSGTTGESPTLAREERIALIRLVKQAVGIPVIANVGTNDTGASVRNARDAEEAGADGILLVAPYYNKPDQDMLFDHFKAIAESVSIPSMLYNVPGRTAVTIRPETVVALSRAVPTIDSIKDASGDLEALTYIIEKAAEGFRVYTGEDALTLPSLACGAYGVVSVAGHVAAPRMKAMIEAYLAGRVEEAARLHRSLRALNKALFLQPNPVPLKKALELRGFPVGGLRPPLKEASEAVSRELAEALAGLAERA